MSDRNENFIKFGYECHDYLFILNFAMEDHFKNIIEKIVKENDQKAFSMLFDHFYPKLFQFSLQFVRHPSYAEDVVSDVFLKLLKNKQRLLAIRNINYYLFRSVKNQSLTFLRDEKKNNAMKPIQEVNDYLIPDHEDPEHEMMDKEAQLSFEEAIEKLPAQRKLVFKLVREEGLNYTEVGELLDISPRTAETHMGIAVKNLCQALSDHLQEYNQHPKVRKIFSKFTGLLLFLY